MRSPLLPPTALLCALLVLLLVGAVALPAAAHEVRPGLLSLVEAEPGHFDVSWKTPMNAGRRLRLYARLPEACAAEGSVRPAVLGDAVIERWRVDCGPQGLIGASLRIEGLERTLTDVLVEIAFADGQRQSVLLKPANPSLTVTKKGTTGAPAFLRLGIEHILFGLDHVLFVIGLLLVVRGTALLIRTITAFTLAHSLTLALSAFDIIRVPQAPVEAAVALSILFLAVELARGRREGLTFRAPFLVAFAFGLLHGLGFATALAEIGLPEGAQLTALLLFNVGVEIGQLAIVAVVLGTLWLSRPTLALLPARAALVVVYAMGTVAAYWLLDRVVGMVG